MNKLQQENETLKRIIKDTFWMARRYAHGRHTYAPSMVREAYNTLHMLFPDIKIENDVTIEAPKDEEIKGMTFRYDYLDDINL